MAEMVRGGCKRWERDFVDRPLGSRISIRVHRLKRYCMRYNASHGRRGSSTSMYR